MLNVGSVCWLFWRSIWLSDGRGAGQAFLGSGQIANSAVGYTTKGKLFTYLNENSAGSSQLITEFHRGLDRYRGEPDSSDPG